MLAGVAAGSGLAQSLHETSLLVPGGISWLAGGFYLVWIFVSDDIQDEVAAVKAALEEPTSPTAEPLKAVPPGNEPEPRLSCVGSVFGVSYFRGVSGVNKNPKWNSKAFQALCVA